MNLVIIAIKRVSLICIIALLACTAYAQDNPEDESFDGRMIYTVRVLGNNTIPESTILFMLKTKPGLLLSSLQIREDIKTLYKSGFFDEVSAETQQDRDGVLILFRVKEKPVVTRIEIVGNRKVSSDTLEKELSMQIKKIYDPILVKKDIDMIQAKYLEKGYNDIEVQPDIVKTSSTSVSVIYMVIEGTRLRIENITFSGNKSFKASKLRKAMKKTREHWLFSWVTDSGKFNEEEFEQDLDLLREFYENNGFARIEIGEPLIKEYEKRLSKKKVVKAVDIEIPLEEGVQYRIGNIEISGNTIFEKPAIMRIIQKIDTVDQTPQSLFKLPEAKFRQGELFSRQALQDALQNLYELYGTRGHIFANIIPNRSFNDETKSIDYVLEIHEGKEAYVNSIEFKGNNRTRDKVIRRQLRIAEGGIFDSGKLRYSLSRLNYLGYIENLKPEFTPSAKDPQWLDISIGLTDERRTELQVGGGYSSVDNVFLQVSFSEYNFLGYGQEFQLSLTTSSRRQDYQLRFVEEFLFDTQNALSFSLFRRRSSYYTDFDRLAIGGDVGLGRHFFEYVFGRISYQYEQIDIYNIQEDARESIKEAEGTSVTSSIVFFLQRDRRNNRRDPSYGTRHYVSYEFASRLFGGDNLYYKASYDGSFFYPLFKKLIYAFHTKIQYADSYSGNTLPAFEYYILGGERSVRGFESSSIGPKDLDYGDRTIGGNKALQFNHELIIPVADPLRLVFFYDAGDVYAVDEPFDVRTLRDSVGIELRVFVPMFWVPIRFIWGYNLAPNEFEPQSEFQFTIGSLF